MQWVGERGKRKQKVMQGCSEDMQDKLSTSTVLYSGLYFTVMNSVAQNKSSYEHMSTAIYV